MKLNKSNVMFFMAIILCILLFFLPQIIELIPSKEAKSIVIIILSILVFIDIIFDIYSDITKKQFTTTVYIVLTDIIEIVAFAVLCYLSFTSYDAANVEVLFKRIYAHEMAVIFFLCAILIRNFLRSQRFMKK